MKVVPFHKAPHEWSIPPDRTCSRWPVLFILLLTATTSVFAQSPSTTREANRSILENFQKLIPYQLGYPESILETIVTTDIPLDPQANWRVNLKRIQEGLHVDYRIIGQQLILFPRKKYLIQGFIYDQQTGESLPGAHLLETQNQMGAVSNDAGYFQLLVPEGRLQLAVSYIGYETDWIDQEVQGPLQMDIRLSGAVNLPEVVVNEQNLEAAAPPYFHPNEQTIPLKTLDGLPSIGSSMDVMRYLQLNAGVVSGGDGLGGIHVRGGNADQNLILLEDIPIFNPYHLFGIGSIFNSYAVQKAEFNKSDFSAAYDGRLSSLLKVTIRDGHRTQRKLDASTGLLDTHILLETPIGKQKGTFMLAGQLSHAGGLIKAYTRRYRQRYDNDGYLQPNFWDVYGKSMIDLNRSNKLIINGYIGSNRHIDVNRYPFEGALDTTYTDQYQDEFYWGNIAAGIKWLHEINGHAFLKLNAYHSGYQYQSINAYAEKIQTAGQTTDGFFEINEFRSSIRENGLKADLEYLLNYRHRLKTGAALALHQYVPGIIAYGEDAPRDSRFEIGSPLPSLPDTLFDELAFTSNQVSIYAEDHWEINAKWKLRYGLSGILFNHATDHFLGVQPRVLLTRHLKSGDLSLSIDKLYQPQHLITATDNGLPNELWVPATAAIRPQQSGQADLSWNHSFSEWTSIKSSIYFKKMWGLVNFQDEPGYLSYGPLDNVDASAWEDDVITGDGSCWGMETSLQQHWDKFHLQVNYTYSKSDRFFAGKNEDYIVPYEFEVPHAFNLMGIWPLNDRWQFSLTWQLTSGTSVVLTPGDYEVYDHTETFVEDFVVARDEIDLLIVPAYHRLDLSATCTLKSNAHFNHQFKLSLVNVYNQQNIVLPRIYRDYDDHSTIRYGQGLPFVPSIAYRLLLQ